MRSPARKARSHKWQTTTTICYEGALHHTANDEPGIRTRMRQQLEVHTATERDRARGEVAQSDQRRTVITEDNSAVGGSSHVLRLGPFSMCARKAEAVRHESTTSPAQWHGGKLAAAW